jgi:hypothetical protein
VTGSARTAAARAARLAAFTAIGLGAAVATAAPAVAVSGAAAATAEAGAITRFYAQYGNIYQCRSEGPYRAGNAGANSWYCTADARLYLTWYT